jgi:3,4-dihydroxy-2-butanone 4-phosphate synthase
MPMTNWFLLKRVLLLLGLLCWQRGVVEAQKGQLELESNQLELDRNRDKWNDLDLVDYDYTLQVSCRCLPSFTSPKFIEVRDSEIFFVAELETEEEAGWTDHETVEDLFDAIQRAIDNSYSTIDVEYNECFGYPMEVSTNPSTQMADAGTSTEIRDFVPQQIITAICNARDPPTPALVSLPTSSPTGAPTIDLGAKQADLNVARKRWTTATATETIASNNYTFSYEETRNGVSDEDRIIEVRNDTVTSAEAAFWVFDEPGDLADYPTVEDMFGSIQDAIDDDSQVIQIQYDQEYGYPTNILIRRKNSREMLKANVGWMTLYSILQNELDGYKERWNDLKISDYRYGIHVSCFCMPDYVSPKTIEVRDDEIDSITVTGTGDAYAITGYDTVLDAFDDIQNALDRFYSIIEVEYNETYGYPKVVSLNPSTGMADAGIYVEISDLVPLQDIVIGKLEGAGEAPSAGPTKAPVEPPTGAPTKAPVEPPTGAPTEAPVEPPTGAPTKAPVEPPTDVLPTSSPTGAPTIDLGAKQADLNVARKRWTTATATETITSNNYTFSYEETRNGVSDEDRIIEVRNDTVTSAEVAFWVFDEPGDLADYPTVEDMFDSIQDAIDDDSQVIQIQYDQEYGYPTNILIRKANTESLEVQIGWMTLYSILQNELDGYKERWNDLEISDYRYGIHVSCFCMPDYVSPKTIEVRDDEIDSITVTGTGDAYEITSYDTVLDSFGDIQNALDRFYSIIEVEYNETYGYPKVVSLNPSTGMADAGIYVEISDLVPLQDIGIGKLEGAGEAPSAGPTKAPVEPPTDAPTKAPVEPPTGAPTEAPAEPPTDAPTKPPTNAPTKSPSDESPPTDSPTDEASEAADLLPYCWGWFGFFGPRLCRRNLN